MSDSLDNRCRDLLVDLELIERADSIEVVSLTGGVSSEIARVTAGSDSYCTKFALAKLKVEADWRAPVHRNAAEYNWLKFTSKICPQNVPNLYGRSIALNGFAMGFVSGNDVRLWKADLFSNGVNLSDIAAVASVLGEIHQASARADFDCSAFDNMQDFYALRLEPYFASLVEKHPNLSAQISNLIALQQETQPALIHGDVSPKNIMFKGDVPIFLDAECATMGDPAFDVGFCLNHLLLKAVHMPHRAGDFIDAAGHFWNVYTSYIDWEDPAECQRRLAVLLPAFLLARIDGKSPVEYLSEQARNRVRNFALPNIETPLASLAKLINDFREAL